ncbi:MAG: GTPase Era [Proteobacteria bacterium]|nr:GTPase Era [Desulfobulbaceae bacterium]MBU4153223.1 GTPase Era [Pseudomonadota bacterium]MDP2106671.1 GTPase Era [Desulfobulbaceae bacterium]
MNQQQNELIKSGMVALVGPPNVGKSTLLNALLGQKISIVSPKPQTTRNRILGIVNGPGYQVVLVDTPGLHKGTILLNVEMLKVAMETLSEVDIIVFMVDATMPPPRPDSDLTECLAGRTTPVILLINKIDLIGRAKILPLIQAYQFLHDFAAIIPISALRGDGPDRVLDELVARLPEGPLYFPDDIPTDATVRSIAAEMIREKVFLLTGQEVPYGAAVMIDRFQEGESLITIDATIIVERDSQKGIVIGKHGAKLKEIGTAARRDIEELTECKVMLKLFVKVVKNWTKNPSFLAEIGF